MQTNVMRLLDNKTIQYDSFCYEETRETNGERIAEIPGENPDEVFKTLVTVGKSGTNYVFVIPVNRELDLKKAAKVVNEKSADMIKSKELLPLTGYIHGGCSPIGMKKFFKTIFHVTTKSLDRIYISAGKVGYQIRIKPEDLEKIINFSFEDIVV